MQTKNNSNLKSILAAAVIVFAAVCAKSFFGIGTRGRLGFLQIAAVLFASVAVSAMISFGSFGKCERLLSGQGVTGVLLLLFIMLAPLGKTIVSVELLISLGFAAVIIILSANPEWILLCAILAECIAVFFDYAAVACLPAALGAAVVAFSPKIGKADKRRKIVFAISALIMLALTVYAFYVRRFTAVWQFNKWLLAYSIPALLIMAALIALAVYSVKVKNYAEAVGYIIPAVFEAVLLTMGRDIIFTSTSALLIMLFVLSGKDTAAAKAGDKVTDYLGKLCKKQAD
ncbi:MAG: hypothetical protein ACI4I3_11145 [Acutalibacteraceae bacterium]